MKYLSTALPEVFIIEPDVLTDARGYFMECYKQSEFNRHCGNILFVQDNESQSTYGVLRGLHLQQGEWAQANLVRVRQGAVLDVAVDVRPHSPDFGKHVAVELSAQNKRQLFIPRHFAHGFVVLSSQAVFTYKVDNVYAPQAERCIRFDDPAISIDWKVPADQLILSEKDKQGMLLVELLS
jgi:dTDP-4-dehydrorhamnose 3,5-epimerase